MNTKEFLSRVLIALKEFPLAQHIDCVPSTLGDGGWEKIDFTKYEVLVVNDDLENLIFTIRTSSKKQFPKEISIQFCASTERYYVLSLNDSTFDVAEETECIDMEMVVWARESDVIYN